MKELLAKKFMEKAKKKTIQPIEPVQASNKFNFSADVTSSLQRKKTMQEKLDMDDKTISVLEL